MTTFILIHGSWHGAWCWYKIVPRLEAAGHEAVAIDLPAHGRDWKSQKNVTLASNVDRVCEEMDRRKGPVILVAHSRGGIIASQVAERRPERIAKTFYLAAYLIPHGRTVAHYFAQDSDSLVPANLERNLAEGWDMLRKEAFREALYADCSEEDVELSTLLLTPEPIQSALTPLELSEERFGSVPRIYIEMLRDRAVSHSLQTRMYTETPCERVMTLDTSHSAYFSQPDALTEMLLSAV